MRILINCLSSVSGGAVSYISNIAPLLCARFNESHDGHRLIFLAHEEQKSLLQLVPDSQIIWINGKRPTGLSRILLEHLNMPRILRDEKIDVLFTTYQTGPLSNGTKHVMMIRNMEPFLCNGYHYSPGNWLRNRLLRIASARALRNADRVIAVSQFAKDFLVRKIGIDENRIRTIYHGRTAGFTADADPKTDLETIGKIRVGKNFLLTCGSLLPYRRCEDVIAAFNQCAGSLDADTQLVIAGAAIDSRYGRLIRRTIAASPYNNRILAVGHVSSQIMAALYRNCLLCIIASEIEACPNIATETMTAGCVIVSSDCPPLPEIFQGCSLEYRSRNIENLAAQIRKGLEDINLRNNKKMQALKRAEDFSWEKCAGLTYSALVN